jgi:ribonuclease HI
VAAASVTESVVWVKRLPDNSIFSAEEGAILLALDAGEQSTHDRFVVFSELLLCLQAIQKRKVANMSILETVSQIHNLLARDKKVAFMSLPSHVGMGGNSAVDAAAKAALNLANSAVPVPFTDFLSEVEGYVRRK